MWSWRQSTGELRHNGRLVAYGYSGFGVGKNNPAAQLQRRLGPIPQGDWSIVRKYDSTAVGPYTLTLHARDGNADDVHDPSGRSAFRIHGDSIKNPGTASRGCIILPRSIRERIWTSGDRVLRVLP